MGKTFVTFDIGDSYIKVVKKDGDKHTLLVRQMPQDLVQDGVVAMSLMMTDFLREIRKELKISKCDCGLVVPDELTVCRKLILPAMTVDQLEVNLPFEFSDYISGKPQRYIYDYAMQEMILDEEGNPKEMVLTGAVMSKESISRYMDIFGEAGFNLKVLIPQEIALTNVMRTAVEIGKAQEDKEYCLVNLGHRSTQVYIFKGDKLDVLRNIYVGGATIDAAIAGSENIDEFVANTYKHNNYNKVLESEACKESFGRIAVEIMKVINFYRFSNRESELEDIYFFGGCSNIFELCDSITEANGLYIKQIADLLPTEIDRKMDMIGLYALGVTMQ